MKWARTATRTAYRAHDGAFGSRVEPGRGSTAVTRPPTAEPPGARKGPVPPTSRATPLTIAAGAGTGPAQLVADAPAAPTPLRAAARTTVATHRAAARIPRPPSSGTAGWD